MTIILLLIITGAFALIFIQSRKIKSLNERINNIPPPMPDISISAEDAENPFATKAPKRKGIIKKTVNTTNKSTGVKSNHNVVIEVGEIESLANNMSRIQIINITGSGDDGVVRYTKNSLPEIIETSEITFI